MTEPTPPRDEAAEQSVLGGMMLSIHAIADALEVVEVEDFYSLRHQTIFTAIVDLYNRGEPTDAIAVGAELNRRQEFDRVGGVPYMHTLIATVPTATNAGYYAEIVAEKAILRRLVVAGTRVKQLGYHGADAMTIQEIVENVQTTVESAVSGVRRGIEVAEPADLAREALEAYASPAEPSTPMGWSDLDAVTGGMKGGQMIVVAARPGVGKSVLSLNTALNVAKNGLTSVVFSLEMSKQEVTDRSLANLGSVDLGHIERREFVGDDWARLQRAGDRFAKLPMRVVDYESINLAGIHSVCADVQRREELGVVVVDYMQLTNGGDSRVSREQQVAGFSRGLKLLAKKLNVPVIAVSQLNRGPEGRTDKRPSLSDLRESGAIEQDADKVLLLHHDQENEMKGASELEVIVAKNRQGRCSSVTLAWSPHYARIGCLSRQEESVRSVA